MATRAPAGSDLAQRLLDAQVAFHLDQWSGERLTDTLRAFAEDLLDALSLTPIADLVDSATLRPLLERVLTEVPGSPGVAALVELATAVCYEGPSEPFPAGAAVDSQAVEALVTRLLDVAPGFEQVANRLAENPLVGVVASRFMGRVVGEVLQANQAAASRVPGLGALVSLGTSTASRLKGAADRQLEPFLGDAMGKGGAYAVRRLNRVVFDTLRDPTTRDALIAAWGQLADGSVGGLAKYAGADEVLGVVTAGHDLAVGTLQTEYAAALAEALLDRVVDWFGGYSTVELLETFGLGRADLVDGLVRSAPRALETLRESGELERLLRAQLEPFYTSPEVVALLGRGLRSEG